MTQFIETNSSILTTEKEVAVKERIHEQNFREIFAEIKNEGREAAEKYSPQELRSLASFVVVQLGDRKGKDLLYQLASEHSQATEADRRISTVNSLDGERRDDKAELALAGLEQMPAVLEGNYEYQISRLQAISECQLVLGREEESIRSQDQVIHLATDHVPVDKLLYYLEGKMTKILIALQRGKLEYKGNVEKALVGTFAKYENLLDDPQLVPGKRSRAVFALYSKKGELLEFGKDFNGALESFVKAFDVINVSAISQKAFVALEVLYCAHSQSLKHKRLSEVEEFYRQNHPHLQKTYISAVQDKYDFVMDKLELSESK